MVPYIEEGGIIFLSIYGPNFAALQFNEDPKGLSGDTLKLDELFRCW